VGARSECLPLDARDRGLCRVKWRTYLAGRRSRGQQVPERFGLCGSMDPRRPPSARHPTDGESQAWRREPVPPDEAGRRRRPTRNAFSSALAYVAVGAVAFRISARPWARGLRFEVSQDAMSPHRRRSGTTVTFELSPGQNWQSLQPHARGSSLWPCRSRNARGETTSLCVCQMAAFLDCCLHVTTWSR
jgi:hypothetical protein